MHLLESRVLSSSPCILSGGWEPCQTRLSMPAPSSLPLILPSPTCLLSHCPNPVLHPAMSQNGRLTK